MTRSDHIRVTDEGGVRTLRFDRAHQSSMRLDDPFETDFAYPAYLHLTLAVAPHATRAFVIGLGGASVVKRMWRDYPGMRITAVEIDPAVIDVAYERFALPHDERIEVLAGDGRAALEASAESHDIVIVDAFDDETRVPPHLLTEEFGRLVRAHLREGGVLAYNFHGSVCGERSKPFRSLHRTLSNVFERLWVFPVGHADGAPAGTHREIIVLATDAALSTDTLLERIASRVDGTVTVPGFERFGDDLYAEKPRTGDVPVLLDPPGHRSAR